MKKFQYVAILSVFAALLVVGLASPNKASAHRRHYQENSCQPVEVDSRVEGSRFKKSWNQQNCDVTPADVTSTDATCDAPGTYVIPTTENVTYLVDGVAVEAGTYDVPGGTTVTVTAEANEGYTIPEDATAEWIKVFTIPSCEDPGAAVQAVAVTAPQVPQPPKGGVSAGAGGAVSSNKGAVVGMAASVGAVLVGFVARRNWNS